MKTLATYTMVTTLALLVLGGSAWAHGRGQGKGQTERTAGDKVREVLPPSVPVFTTRERTITTNWFSTNRSSLPPGLAKRDRLPPGLEKQLRERGTLPPGLQKQLYPLPVALERQLSVLPTGYRRVIIGNNIIVMEPATGLIYDIIRIVIP